MNTWNAGGNIRNKLLSKIEFKQAHSTHFSCSLITETHHWVETSYLEEKSTQKIQNFEEGFKSIEFCQKKEEESWRGRERGALNLRCQNPRMIPSQVLNAMRSHRINTSENAIYTLDTWHDWQDWQLTMENHLVLETDISKPLIVQWIKF